MQHTLFISDLHLDEARPAINALLYTFLSQQTAQTQALYILGDLFEYWVGDDDIAHNTLAQDVIQSLARLSQTGTKIYFMAGNRDFLIGERFARLAGLTLLSDPTLIDLYGKPTLLMHGDTLCLDDIDYQQARVLLRSNQWQQNFLSRPLNERHAFANHARIQSNHAKAGKQEVIMDASNSAIDAAFRQYHYANMIHGHTHRPMHHQHLVDGHTCQRWVLPDWHDRGGGLLVNQAGCNVVSFQ